MGFPGFVACSSGVDSTKQTGTANASFEYRVGKGTSPYWGHGLTTVKRISQMRSTNQKKQLRTMAPALQTKEDRYKPKTITDHATNQKKH